MGDEFGTVNARRGSSGRDLEVIRTQYRHHRDALVRMAADAPTQKLASEYQRLIRDIDHDLAKLDEIEGKAPTSPGTRPLITPPPEEQETMVGDGIPPANEPAAAQGSRVMMIVIAGVIVLAAIVWLLWRASGDRNRDQVTNTAPAAVDTTPVTETAVPATTPATVPAAPTGAVLKITPAAADYGSIRKGTRAVRTFSIENTSGAAVPVKVARSTCKCLFYDYAEKVPAHGKETITVTVDGARAKLGLLHETLQVQSKNDPSVAARFDVNAAIQAP